MMARGNCEKQTARGSGGGYPHSLHLTFRAFLEEDPLMVDGGFEARLPIAAEGARKRLHIRVLKESAQDREPSNTEWIRGWEGVIQRANGWF